MAEFLKKSHTNWGPESSTPNYIGCGFRFSVFALLWLSPSFVRLVRRPARLGVVQLADMTWVLRFGRRRGGLRGGRSTRMDREGFGADLVRGGVLGVMPLFRS